MDNMLSNTENKVLSSLAIINSRNVPAKLVDFVGVIFIEDLSCNFKLLCEWNKSSHQRWN